MLNDRAPAPHSWVLNRHLIMIMAALCVCILLNPLAHWQGRFWAEEGTDFFQTLYTASFGQMIAFLYKGTLQLTANIAVWTAASVSIKHAPLITTWIGTGFLLNFAYLFSLWAASSGIGPRYAVAGLCAFLVSGASYEILSNATNLQWICSFSVLLIALLPPSAIITRKVFFTVFVLLAGLSGVPSCMLAPVMALRALIARSWLHLGLAAILGICAIGQLAFMAGADTGPRAFSYDIGETVYAAIVRPIAALFLTSKGAAISMGLVYDAVPFALLLLAALAVLLGCVIWLTWTRHADLIRNEVTALLFAWIFVTLLNVFGSLADGSNALRGIGGDRYYLLGSLSLVLILLLLTRMGKDAALIVAFCLGGIIMINLAYAVLTQSPVKYNHVASWHDQIERCKETPEAICDLAIWPNETGTGNWVVHVRKKQL